MSRNATPKPLVAGQDRKGRFTKGNKLGPGRRLGSRNRPYDTGTKLLLEGKNQSAAARRFCSLLLGIVSDLGGQDALSTGELQLARRCAQISVQCEIMEQKAAEGETFDVTGYGILTGHLTRALRAIGLKRVPRDVTPTLQDYLDAAQPSDASDPEPELTTVDP
jgi:hypothetical protein